MQVMYDVCCGLDVHKKSITACMLMKESKEILTFGTMTEDIISLVDWVKSKGCKHVAMESTSVFWKPIYNLMEAEDIEALVVNAKHIKAVPGRKTDVKDAEWIAQLLKHGLLRGSYIPDRDQRELRELVRYRRSLIQERSREISRLQKILEGANIKLSSVVSNVLGVSSREMLDAIIKDGENIDVEVLAGFARGKMKNKAEDLKKALTGLIGAHQRMILSDQLDHIDFLTEKIEKLDKEVEARMRPFEEDLALLDTIPGVGIRTAQDMVAEIGINMDRFPSAEHLSSWAGMSPGNNESAGKRMSGKTNKANKHLRTTLVEAARAAAHTKDTYLSAQYSRLASRRGGKKAAIAVGHSILVITYHILKRHKAYMELGSDYFEKQKKDAVIKNAVKKLQTLGFEVTLSEKVA